MIIKTDDVGVNISNAFDVVLETYENLSKMLSEMDIVGNEEGFESLTPKYLRWKSDAHPSGWFTRSFIKLYQLKDTPNLKDSEVFKNGPIFGIEVNFEKKLPVVILSKYTYDFSSYLWDKAPAVSSHWGYYKPIHNHELFTIVEHEDLLISTPNDNKIRENYWNLQSVRYKKINLTQIDSKEKIRIDIFKVLKEL